MQKDPPTHQTTHVTTNDPSRGTKRGTRPSQQSSTRQYTTIGDRSSMIRVTAPFKAYVEEILFTSPHTVSSTARGDSCRDTELAADSNRSTNLETNLGFSTYCQETASNTSFDADWRELPYEKLSAEDIPESTDGWRMLDSFIPKPKEKPVVKKKQRGVSWKEQTDLRKSDDENVSQQKQLGHEKADGGKQKPGRRQLLIRITRKKKVVHSATQISVLTDDSDSSLSGCDENLNPHGDSPALVSVHRRSKTDKANWMSHTFSHVLHLVRKRGSPELRNIDRGTSPLSAGGDTSSDKSSSEWSREPLNEISCYGVSLPDEAIKSIIEHVNADTDKAPPDLISQRTSQRTCEEGDGSSRRSTRQHRRRRHHQQPSDSQRRPRNHSGE